MGITTTAAVQALLGPQNYDGTTDLQQFIDSADLIIQNIPAYAASKNIAITNGLAPSQMEIIERWLSAHMYCMNNPQFQTEATGGISVSYTGQSGLHLRSTRYGQMAITLDFTGYLNMLDGRRVATATWLGWSPPCGTSPPPTTSY